MVWKSVGVCESLKIIEIIILPFMKIQIRLRQVIEVYNYVNVQIRLNQFIITNLWLNVMYCKIHF